MRSWVIQCRQCKGLAIRAKRGLDREQNEAPPLRLTTDPLELCLLLVHSNIMRNHLTLVKLPGHVILGRIIARLTVNRRTGLLWGTFGT